MENQVSTIAKQLSASINLALQQGPTELDALLALKQAVATYLHRCS